MTTEGQRNSYGRKVGSWSNYKDAKARLDYLLKTPPPGVTLMIRMVYITDSIMVLPAVIADTLTVEVPDIPAPPIVHALAQSLPYTAPPGYEGQSHMCDTNGGLIALADNGPLVPCCSVCGQPTD